MLRIPTAVLLLVLSQAAAHADDQKLCEHLERSAANLNKDSGKWIDKVTRQDGATVLCGTKSIEFKKTINVGFEKLPSDWRATQQRAWNDAHCKDPAWRRAILAGWTVATSYTAPNGARDRIVAVCSKTEARGIEAPSNDQVVTLVDQSMRLFMTSVREKSMQTFWNHVSLQAQQRYSVAQFDEAFKNFYTGATFKGDPLAGRSPVFNTQPAVDANGWLAIEGYYPTTPARLEFRLQYVTEGLGWKVRSINVKMTEPSASPAK